MKSCKYFFTLGLGIIIIWFAIAALGLLCSPEHSFRTMLSNQAVVVVTFFSSLVFLICFIVDMSMKDADNV